ncbi:MAG: DUF2062 domain-containing protein [Roseibacillus sp.]
MTRVEPSAVSESSSRRAWWRRWIVDPIRNQLQQGVAPSKLGWAAALGVTVGVIPIMGTVSAVSVAGAAVFKLNQPITHLFTRLMLPLHLLLIVPFIRLGQRIHGAELLSATVPELVQQFQEAPMKFLGDFGLAAWHGFVAWALVAPFLLFAVKLILTPLFQILGKRMRRNEEVAA